MADEDIEMGGIKHAGVGGLLQGVGTEVSSLWVGDVGDNPLHGPGPGGGPIIGCINRSLYGTLGSVWTADESNTTWRRQCGRRA